MSISTPIYDVVIPEVHRQGSTYFQWKVSPYFETEEEAEAFLENCKFDGELAIRQQFFNSRK